jgi:hypothetical protein
MEANEALQQAQDLLSTCEEQTQLLQEEIDTLAIAMSNLPPTRAGEERLLELDQQAEDKQRLLDAKTRLLSRLRQRVATLSNHAGGGAVPPGGAATSPTHGHASLVPRGMPSYTSGKNVREFIKAFERTLHAHALNPNDHWE